ncbi:MAG: helix-turn-helix transcriptional regulator [Chitinophagaceae bacterium]
MPDRISDGELRELIEKKGYSDQSTIHYPVGSCAGFLLSNSSLSLLDADVSILSLTGTNKSQFIGKTLSAMLTHLTCKEHGVSVQQLYPLGLDFINNTSEPAPLCNLEFNLHHPKFYKRIMLQLKPLLINKTKKVVLTRGFLVDITHLLPQGLPRLSLFRNNQLYSQQMGTLEEVLRSLELPLTLRDLKVLTLKNRGLRAKEIARELKMKELSIYSIFRDMKKKTDMESLPLINLLKDKGLI